MHEGLALRELVVMVWKLEVLTPGVDVHAATQHSVRHRRALDVPPWPPWSPLAVPGWLSWLGRLPQRKVLRDGLTAFLR